MPDLNPDGTVALDPEADDATTRALAIANCELCDDDGYRGARVCNHRDYLAESANGRALAMAELAKIAARKAGAK